MKLLYCTECHDVVRLFKATRECECGATGGRYLNRSQAEVFGDGVPFSILNSEFNKAIQERTDEWPGVWFRGCIIPHNATNLLKIEADGPRS